MWQVESTPGKLAILTVQGLGVSLIVASTVAIDHFELFGLRQTWAYFRATEPAQVRFQTPLLYRIVRHPMPLRVVIVFWATPHLRPATACSPAP